MKLLAIRKNPAPFYIFIGALFLFFALVGLQSEIVTIPGSLRSGHLSRSFTLAASPSEYWNAIIILFLMSLLCFASAFITSPKLKDWSDRFLAYLIEDQSAKANEPMWKTFVYLVLPAAIIFYGGLFLLVIYNQP